jgi:uncharacterized protein
MLRLTVRFFGFGFTTGWILEVIGIMIVGMGLYRTGFLSASLPSTFYLKVALAGYAISGSVVLIGLHHASQYGFSDAVVVKWIFLPYGVGQIACMLANASVILIAVRCGFLVHAQRMLAAVGRMALSNYLLTSILCQFLFKRGPWKLYGQLDYYEDLYVVGCVWTLNIVISMLTLRYFRFGPMEWIWRSLTYWKRQPMRIERIFPSQYA